MRDVINLERGARILGLIQDEIQQRLNPSGDDCQTCGGDGVVFECFDGFCQDAEAGCEDCTRRCQECARANYDRLRGVRLEVLRSLDVDTAAAWLREVGRLTTATTAAEVLANIHAARSREASFTPREREASACWLEGLL